MKKVLLIITMILCIGLLAGCSSECRYFYDDVNSFSVTIPNKCSDRKVDCASKQGYQFFEYTYSHKGTNGNLNITTYVGKEKATNELLNCSTTLVKNEVCSVDGKKCTFGKVDKKWIAVYQPFEDETTIITYKGKKSEESNYKTFMEILESIEGK